jgi:hypothetical protein
VLVGDGLGNALIALALLPRRPATRTALVEQQATLGGNHIWCFRAGESNTMHISLSTNSSQRVGPATKCVAETMHGLGGNT